MEATFNGLCRTTGIVVGLLAFLSIAGVCAAEGEGELKATLSLDADSYAVGQPVFFVLVLENTGPKAIQAHLRTPELAGFRLEMAFENDEYQRLDYYQWERGFMTKPSMRDLKPGEMLGVSEAILLRGRRPTLDRAKEKGADLTRWLVADRVGSYRLRATVRVDLGEKILRIRSNEVAFDVTPPMEGCQDFLEFAMAHVQDNLQIFEEGYKAGRDVLKRLEGTAYRKYVLWAMMVYYFPKRMDPEEPPLDVSDEEREEREAYKRLAEQIVAEPSRRRTRMGEMALLFLLAYELDAQHPQEALQYGAILQDELPWSGGARSATLVQELLQEEPLPERTK